MPGRTEDYHAGAKRLLQDCVSLERNDVVAIVYDETTEEVANILSASATAIGIEARSLRKTTAEQLAFDPVNGLTDDLLNLFSQARASLTCVAADARTTKFRRALVQQAVRNNTRVGHMPGAGLEVLESALTVDFEAVERRCEELALALTVGRNVAVRSRRNPDGDGGKEYELHLDIGGLDRSAVVSSGRIPLGRWGNIPGGETFIAPMEETANGQICLNGAFRGRVLKPSESLVLDFVAGRLEAVHGPAEVARSLEAMFKTAIDDADQNWRMLAELGIGANDGVRELKGVSLVDEKCLGTAHIALGDNTTFGGRSESAVHEDLVIASPTLQIDGKPVLDSGKYVLRPRDWLDRLDDMPAGELDFPADTHVWRSVVKARPRDGRLVVEIGISDGRLNSYILGDERATRLLAQIYAAIPIGGIEIRFDELARAVLAAAPEWTYDDFQRGMALLQKHRVAVIKKQNGGRR